MTINKSIYVPEAAEGLVLGGEVKIEIFQEAKRDFSKLKRHLFKGKDAARDVQKFILKVQSGSRCSLPVTPQLGGVRLQSGERCDKNRSRVVVNRGKTARRELEQPPGGARFTAAS